MSYILSTILSVIVIELFFYLPFMASVNGILLQAKKSKNVILSAKISDHWKEKILPVYAARMMKYSLITGGLMMVIFSPILISILLSRYLQSDFDAFLLSLEGGIYITLAALIYVSIRKAFAEKSDAQGDYGIFSRLLHRIALSSNSIAEMSFDIDQKMVGARRPDISQNQHVFIAGLARSGTTVLMRHIYNSGEFISLTYREMPFILAPNMWRAISKLSNRNIEMKERAHGDGIEIDNDSPEALEEVFWRVFCGERYIRKNCLIPMSADKRVTKYFVKYVEAILHDKQDQRPDRYLSKNNNNILRLPSIHSAFPNAVIIIPFRSPMQHANSLLAQHTRFTERHKNKPFELNYMNWLVHHEFGYNHKRFQFEENATASQDEFSLDYWLEVWLLVYRYLLQHAPSGAIFISYERLCDTPDLWRCLKTHLSICDKGEGTATFKLSSKPVQFDSANHLYEDANKLHDKLLERCLKFETA